MNTPGSAPKLALWLPHAGSFFSPSAEGDQFSPTASWQQSYVVINNALEPRPGAEPMRANGFLRIKRTALPDDGRCVLDVELLFRPQYAGAFHSSIRMECDSSPLRAPQAWKLESVSLDPQGQPVEGTRYEESGRVEKGQIIREGRRNRIGPLPAPFTSNWSLFDAVQAMFLEKRSGKGQPALEFDLLEDLDLWKPKQRLSYWGEVDVELGGRPMRLAGYQQIGEGILPYHYWLDETGRLILAYGGLRGFIFNPNAEGLAGRQAPARRKDT